MAIESLKLARWLVPLLIVASLASPVTAHPPHDEMAPEDPWMRPLVFESLDGYQLGLTNEPSNESAPWAQWTWDRSTLSSCCFGWYEVEYEKQLIEFSGDDFPLAPQDSYKAQIHLSWWHGESFPLFYEERPYAILDFYLDDGCSDASYAGQIVLETEYGEEVFPVDLVRYEEHHEEASGGGNGSAGGHEHNHTAPAEESGAACGDAEPWAHDLALTLVVTAFFGGSLTQPSLLGEYMDVEMHLDGASFLIVREKPVELQPPEPLVLRAEEVAVDDAIEEAAADYEGRATDDPEVTVPGPSLAPVLVGVLGAAALAWRRRRAV